MSVDTNVRPRVMVGATDLDRPVSPEEDGLVFCSAGSISIWNRAAGIWVTIASGGVPNLYFPSLADLRAFSYTPGLGELVAWMAGFYTPGDGGGGLWVWDPTNMSADNTGTIVKPANIALGDPGRWFRIFSGPIDVRWFGAKGDGITDDTTPIQDALALIGRIYLPAGTYAVSSIHLPAVRTSIEITGDAGTNQGVDSRSVLIPINSTGDIITIADQSSAGPPEIVRIEHITVDGLGRNVTGIHINRCQNLAIRDCTVTRCAIGIWMDGTAAAAGSRLLNVLIENCFTSSCSDKGVYLNSEAPTPVTGSLGGLVLVGHASEEDAVGVWIDGSFGIAPCSIIGGEIQASTIVGLKIVSAPVGITGLYIETGPGIPTMDVSVNARVSAWSGVLGNPVVDSTSVLTTTLTHINSRETATTSRLGMLYDTGLVWGPPNLGSIGAVYQVGSSYTDSYGIEWTCVIGGTSGDSAFIAKGGKIIRPIDFSELINGNTLWYPQRPFLLERVTLVVTATLATTTATDLSFATFLASSTDNLIALPTQLALNLLTTGATVAAATNTVGDALISSGKVAYLDGTKPINGPPSAGNRIEVFTHPTPDPWTSGSCLLIIEGSYLGL